MSKSIVIIKHNVAIRTRHCVRLVQLAVKLVQDLQLHRLTALVAGLLASLVTQVMLQIHAQAATPPAMLALAISQQTAHPAEMDYYFQLEPASALAQPVSSESKPLALAQHAPQIARPASARCQPNAVPAPPTTSSPPTNASRPAHPATTPTPPSVTSTAPQAPTATPPPGSVRRAHPTV